MEDSKEMTELINNSGTQTKKVIENPALNRLGLQPLRYTSAKLIKNYRRHKYESSKDHLCQKDDPGRFDIESALTSLLSEGFYALNSFLPEQSFLKVKEEFLTIMGDKLGVNMPIVDVDTEIQRQSFSLDMLREKHLHATVSLLTNKNLWKIISLSEGRFSSPSSTTFWFDIIKNGNNPCVQNQLHTDTFFDTYKVWFFLKNVDSQDGPLAFYPKSHLFSLRRCIFEYNKSNDLKSNSEYSWRLTKQDINLFKSKEIKFEVPQNTLLIVNTHGFHCRSESIGGTERHQIHFAIRSNPWDVP
jgi:hypothetical protein